jgi:hypothetical protein
MPSVDHSVEVEDDDPDLLCTCCHRVLATLLPGQAISGEKQAPARAPGGPHQPAPLLYHALGRDVKDGLPGGTGEGVGPGLSRVRFARNFRRFRGV